MLTRIPVEFVRLAGILHNAIGPKSRCTRRHLETSAPVPENVRIFLDRGLGFRPNVIGADQPTIDRRVQVQRQEHGRWFRTVDRDFKAYANEYCRLLSLI